MNYIDALCQDIYADNHERGFWDADGYDEFFIGTKLALIHGEVSEALEALRKGEFCEDKHLPHYSNFAVELADIVIRTLDLAGAKGIPLGQVINEKLEFNKGRPYKHNKAF